ncbi:MAG: hypothetical protein ACRC1F_02335 [Metamycoplasmataceae bacterium]
MKSTEYMIAKKRFSKIVNRGFYISLANIVIISFLIFTVAQIFLDPLNNNLWFSLFMVSLFLLFVSLIFLSFLLIKIIVNNNVFFKMFEKHEKRYFIIAVVLFLVNSAISFSMFKKMLSMPTIDRDRIIVKEYDKEKIKYDK